MTGGILELRAETAVFQDGAYRIDRVSFRYIASAQLRDRRRRRRVEIGIDKFDAWVDTDRGKYAPGNGVEEGFRQFAIILVKNTPGVDRFHAGPGQFVFDALSEQPPDDVLNRVRRLTVKVQPFGRIVLETMPVPVEEPLRGAPGDVLERGMKRVEPFEDRLCP